jgi:lipid A disaccharide synthetase
VIIGPGFENEDEIRDAATETDANFNLLRDPDDLPRRMFEADFAVSATGSTVYELLATGTPVVGVPQTDNQTPISKTLSSRDAILLPHVDVNVNFPTEAGSSSSVRLISFDKGELISELTEAISEMVNNEDLRCQLRNNGMSMVDCRGPERVYDRVTEI